jgi:uncharacterized protein
MNMSNLQYFKSSFIVTLIGLGLALYVGGIQGLIIAAVLGVLEVSLSFDNAIVNAKTLEDMDAEWRHRFVTWGMVIAVFGMRLLFPVLIVSVIAEISPYNALYMALTAPSKYEQVLTSAHTAIMGYGGSFLFMVFLKFFLDETKDIHWFKLIEEQLTKLGKIEAIEVGIVLIASIIVSQYLTKVHGQADGNTFLISSIFGLITYIAADGLGAILEEEDGEVVIRSGVASFIYLEILDASFSFDGVLGALAVTDNIIIIMIGLGIGAMFVRSLTLMFVDKKTLTQFLYLEHAAFWAIGTLATIMYINPFYEIPEVVTGLIGAALIGLGFWHSIIINKKEAI